MSEVPVKDASILVAIDQLRARLGPDTFVIADHWDDLFAVGLAAPAQPGRLVYISTFGKPPGRFDASLELPPAPASDLPYTPNGDRSDLDIAALVSLLREHLRLPGSRPG